MTKGQTNGLGDLVRRLREEAGLTLRGLATKADVDVANLSRLEHGEAVPKRATLERLAHALGADLADFLTLAGYATGEALPSFTPYLRTKYGHLPAAKRKELEKFFEQIETDYGAKAKQPTKKSTKRTAKGGH